MSSNPPTLFPERSASPAITDRVNEPLGLTGIERHLTNLGATYLLMVTETRLASGGIRRTVNLELNPWILRFGLTPRF
jgi:hypothetical protein